MTSFGILLVVLSIILGVGIAVLSTRYSKSKMKKDEHFLQPEEVFPQR